MRIALAEQVREVESPDPIAPAIARLASERGATMPTTDLLSLKSSGEEERDKRPIDQILDEMREERL